MSRDRHEGGALLKDESSRLLGVVSVRKAGCIDADKSLSLHFKDLANGAPVRNMLPEVFNIATR